MNKKFCIKIMDQWNYQYVYVGHYIGHDTIEDLINENDSMDKVLFDRLCRLIVYSEYKIIQVN